MLESSRTRRTLTRGLLLVTMLVAGMSAAAPGAAADVAPLVGSSVLDPAAFGTGLGTLSAASGDTLVFDTLNGAITRNGAQIRPADSGSVVSGIGVLVNANGSGITGFYLDGVDVAAGATVTYIGPYALGLLTTGHLSAAGILDADALGSPTGQGLGAGGTANCSAAAASGAAGASFSGIGGRGGNASTLLGGIAAPAYGNADLSSSALPVGSGGGSGRTPGSCQSAVGGAGGGGLAIISLGSVDLRSATLTANGAFATATAAPCYSGSGGGSGGSILVVAPAYVDDGSTHFQVSGGTGANAHACAGTVPLGGGGAGGGGRLTVVTGAVRHGIVAAMLPTGGTGAGGGQPGSPGTAPTTFDTTFLSVAGPATGDAGTSLTFTATPTVGDVSSYAWDFGDGLTATTADGTATHSYAEPGTYPVSVTATMTVSGANTAASTSVDVAAAAPAAPANVTPTVTGPNSASVAFTAGPDHGSPITGFDVQCTSTTGGTARSKSGSASPLAVGSLTTGATYHCRVRATNALGTGPYSAYSQRFVPQTVAPAAPTRVRAIATGATSARVTFRPRSDGGSPITAFQAECSSTTGGITRTRTGSASPLIVNNLTTGATYQCRVRATNAIGTGAYSDYSNSFAPSSG